jgi:uncharacterized damage-inducible protein DinB
MNAQQQIIAQVVNAWAAQNKRISTFFNKYDDDTYLNEVAPGRNRAVYLLGHLTAIADDMLSLLGLGDKLYPHLEEQFLRNPDRFFEETPGIEVLKESWQNVNAKLTEHFAQMNAGQWLEKHSRVTAEDFITDPTRNKLNVLLSRTTHTGYHMGQLTFLIQKELAV